MDGREEGCMPFGCSPPRGIMARWLSLLRKVKGKTVAVRRERRDYGVTEIRCLAKGLRGGDPLDPSLESMKPDLHRRETTVNMGIGCYLLHLLAAGKDEIHKMVELRTEMEKFLENARENLRRKEDLLSKPSPEPSEMYTYSTTDVPEGPESSNYLLSPQVPSASFSLPESSSSVVHDRSLKRNVSKEEEEFGGMDQLEAELEAELELLQVRLEPQKKHSKQRLRVVAKDVGSRESCSLSSGEVTNLQEESSMEGYGVCPYELERRLHELLEARQHEQIKELEATLESAKHKLHEKETESSWWKGTAYLFSQNIQESSRLNLK